MRLAAQEDSSFVLVRSYEGDIESAAIDHLDQLYLISSTGQIKKFNSFGDSLAVYNQLRNYGKLFSIDVTNPLKILLFYKDFSTVVVLDRFLSIISTIDFRRNKVLQPAAIGLSYDNNIWVYDEYDHRLKKINEQGAILTETSDLRQALNETPAPQKILNNNNLVFLADTAYGIFVFDNYGSFKRKLPLMNWQSIAVNRNQLISTSGEMIGVFDLSNQLSSNRKIPVFAPYHQSFLTADRFVHYNNQKLTIYKYRF